MKVLVTGGAGYIGSIAVEALVADGAQVVVFDNLSQGHRQAVHPAAELVHGDLRDAELVRTTLARHRPDGIMHFAAYSLVGESMQKPFLYLRDNLVCAANLLESAAASGVRYFILSSTANLFSTPARVPIAEDEAIVPGSPYGESKYLIERYLTWMERIYGMRSICLRYFNASGASRERGEDHRPELHLIPLILQVAMGKRASITVFGDDYDTPDGTCVRDYIHVEDLADAHILALKALMNGANSATYNLGNGQGYSVKQVIDTAKEVTGRPIATELGARRPGDPPVLVASSDAVRHALGWQPRHTSLRAILESAWQWHVRFPNGYSE